jgi:hypothetical protein
MSFRLRLRIAAVLVALVSALPTARAAETPVSEAAVPRARCGPGSAPELSMQGRLTTADYVQARSAGGITCNTKRIGHLGATGGFRVHRYIDPAGHECAYYDTTQLFPTEYLRGGISGVAVLDMTDPAHPVETARLLTPAMLTPHESLSINTARGLLAADMGNPFAYPGIFDIYDLTKDCRHPVLLSSLPIGVLGHEGGFAPDGKTFYVTSIAGVFTALDVTNPVLPVPLFADFGYRPHGINISDDGNRLYMADIANAGATGGLTILDVSEIQRRAPLPKVRVVSKLSWPTVSVPQTAIPVSIGGHPYIVEVDEFARDSYRGFRPDAPVGAARIIDIADDKRPRVVSNIKLEVNAAANRATVSADPGGDTNLGGYTAHYCAVPQRRDPGIVACTFNLSGLRVFDIRDPLRPKELAYFNVAPATNTPSAMSAPAFAPERGEIWYADGNSGFHVVRLTNNAWPFPAPPRPAVSAPPTVAAAGDELPASGATAPLTLSAALIAIALATARAFGGVHTHKRGHLGR